MFVVLDRINYSCTAYTPLKQNKGGYKRSLRWYSYQTRKKKKRVKSLVQTLWDCRKNHCVFITITTQQHKTGMTDQQLNEWLRHWLKNRKDRIKSYIWIAERQKNTGDLHYHIFAEMQQGKFFNIPREVYFIAKAFGVPFHGALFNVKLCTSKPLAYLSKYMSKTGDCMGLFQGRTIGADQTTTNNYKRNAFKYVRRVVLTEELNKILSTIECYTFDFGTSYKFSLDLWSKVVRGAPS